MNDFELTVPDLYYQLPVWSNGQSVGVIMAKGLLTNNYSLRVDGHVVPWSEMHAEYLNLSKVQFLCWR